MGKPKFTKKQKPKFPLPQPKLPISEKNVVKPKNIRDRKLSIKEISQKPSYIYSSLIILLIGAIGGIPGIFKVVSYFTDRPSFKYHPRAMYVGQYRDPIKKQSGQVVIISGILENNGEKPLFINGPYGLTVETPKYGIVSGKASLLPPNMDTTAINVKASYSNLIDMEKIYRLNPLEPIACTASFSFPYYVVPDLITNKTLFTINCLDLNGKEYKDTFHFSMNLVVSGTELPELGISLLPLSHPIDTLKK